LIAEKIIFCSKPVLSADEAARFLSMSRSTLYKKCMLRQIPHYKSATGKLLYFNRTELEEWMQSTKVSTNEEIDVQAREYINKSSRRAK